MKLLFLPFKSLKLFLLLVAVIAVGGYALFHAKTNDVEQETYRVERGQVAETVSISGFVEAKNTANLSFPTTGIVTDVFVSEGDVVAQGDLLATLGSRTLVAQRSEAVARLSKAQASYDELVSGPRDEAREVTSVSVATAEASYAETVALEAEKVENARVALLSNDLEILAEKADTRATAPTITGNYTCEEEGVYNIESYASEASSGYSYRYSGLETGTAAAYTRQPARLGNCGLYIQFTEGDIYSNKKWVLKVPNTESATYVTYKNAYDLAKQTQATALQSAQDALTLARSQATLANAAPTTEELRQVQADINQAAAAIAAIDAQIEEKSIVAPFEGMITDVDILPGETAGVSPIITVLADTAFELTARIPEIDIRKVYKDQRATVVFDANQDVVFEGTVTFVSPLATEIDGVAYFETTITLDEVPDWIRSGLNADVEILARKEDAVLKIPKRYSYKNDDGETAVLLKNGNAQVETTITVEFVGNDGYLAITGLNEGDTLVAPLLE